ncbi:hypothetical protein BJX63DRAFT_404671 [Aspergillus granulosus]|uniref:Uncharacterized protein n=1 Tax=Aspergillus granulosus TaxID=176169 RepID=A0ABR4H2N0_9EURO
MIMYIRCLPPALRSSYQNTFRNDIRYMRIKRENHIHQKAGWHQQQLRNSLGQTNPSATSTLKVQG